MFAVRGIAVSFSIFVILYGALSLTVLLLWRRLWRYGQQHSARRSADLLFIARMLPFAVAAGATLALAVPSFLLLEPRAVNEPMGTVAVVLGCCGVVVVLAGTWKAVTALLRASRTIAQWSSQSHAIGSNSIDSISIESGDSVAVLRISSAVPPLTAAGILKPSVWLSGAAEFVLTERELRTALRHEVIHLRHRDNLRKLLLRFVAFPGMVELESAWRESTEMAADDAAVSSASEALDLAAAVIKLSRLTPLTAPAELTTALVNSPVESVNARVERLIAWTESRQVVVQRFSWRYPICAVLAMIAFAATYSELLISMHAATEWLVR